MSGMLIITRKEFTDHVSSRKFLLIFGTLLLVILVSTLQSAQSFITSADSGTTGAFQLREALSSVATNISLVGGILAIAVSFDAVNREKTRGSLKVLLSYPIYRDAVIGGKFLGGLAVMTVVAASAFLAGVGTYVAITGIPFSADSIVRLSMFLGISIIYLTLFLGIGLLLSLLFSEPSTSLLGAMVVWLASAFLISSLGWAVGTMLYPSTFTFTPEQMGNASLPGGFQGGPGEAMIERVTSQASLIRRIISSISPSESYETAVSAILTTSQLQMRRGGQPTVTTISIEQAAMTALPNIIYLIAALAVTFAISYVRFTREEIR